MEILIGQFIKHPLKIKPINEYKSNLLGKHMKTLAKKKNYFIHPRQQKRRARTALVGIRLAGDQAAILLVYSYSLEKFKNCTGALCHVQFLLPR